MTLRYIKVLSVLPLLLIYACSATAPVTEITTEEKTISVYPEWFANDAAGTDSLSYFGFGTAVASDSLVAIEKAATQAKVNLEKLVDETSEEIRNDLVDKGSTDANNTDFIIILRKANTQIRTAATTQEVKATKMNGNYRAFVKAGISKSEIRSVLEKGFTGHPRYWGGFSGVESFVTNF